MLLRHSFYYIFAIGLPGLLNFAALIVFTRLLTPRDFGRYTLMLSVMNLLHVVLFQWLQMVIARFLPADEKQQPRVLGTILALFLVLASVISLLGGTLVLLWPDSELKPLLALCVLLTLAQAWLQINLTLASTQLAPKRVGYLMGSKSLLALFIGGGLAALGLGSLAPIIGLLIGAILAWLVFGIGAWRHVRARWPSQAVSRDYITYGLPLILTFALGWVIASSDRLLIAWLLDEAATGVYAAGYDLAQQSLGILLSIVNTAAYPLVMRQMNQNGEKAASEQLARNGELVITVAMSAAAGLIALAPVIVEVTLGKDFQSGALVVLPWIAAAAAVLGIKSFHLDISFQLARQSRWQVYTSFLAAVTNIVLGFLLIPKYGILGAAWATLIACSAAALVSWLFGNRVFQMPAFSPLFMRGLLVAGLTYFGAWINLQLKLPNQVSVVLGVLSGMIFCFMGVLILDVVGVRTIFLYQAKKLIPYFSERFRYGYRK